MATSFVEELKRRNVSRAAIIYFVVSWLPMKIYSIRDEPEFQKVVAELEARMAVQLEAINALPDMGELDLRYKELN